MLKEYLTSGNKTYENSNPFYRNPWLFHVQVFKALMGQAPRNRAQSGKDGDTVIVRTR